MSILEEANRHHQEMLGLGLPARAGLELLSSRIAQQQNCSAAELLSSRIGRTSLRLVWPAINWRGDWQRLGAVTQTSDAN